MMLEAVGLNHKPLRSPQEVDEEAADADVHLRARNAVAPAQSQEPALEATSGRLG